LDNFNRKNRTAEAARLVQFTTFLIFGKYRFWSRTGYVENKNPQTTLVVWGLCVGFGIPVSALDGQSPNLLQLHG